MPDTGSEHAVEQVATLPTLAMRGPVPFPGGLAPIVVGRPASRAAVAQAQKAGDRLFVVMQKVAETEEPGPDDLCPVGVVAQVLKVLPFNHGDSQTVVLRATDRARIRSMTKVDGYLETLVAIAPPAPALLSVEVEALAKSVTALVREIVGLTPEGNPDVVRLVESAANPGELADTVAMVIDLTRDQKQEVLETLDVTERLRKLVQLASRALEVLQVGRKIEQQVHGELAEATRKQILRQQLRAIQKELGEEEDLDVARLRKAMEEANLPAEPRAAAERELQRLVSMQPGMMERTWVVTYLDWLVSLPWSKLAEERADLEEARTILEREHFGLAKAKERILESLAVHKLHPAGRSGILCFVGPPGVGKTSLAQAVAEATGRNLVRISVGGVSDESEIRGHRRTYVGALPGRILSALRKAGTRNPVFVIDEIDKMAASFHGDPAAALLEVLDPEQNATFADRYVEIPFDLSQVLFITTANTLDPLPRPLLDRLEVIEIPGYTEEEKLRIARDHLLPRRMEAVGLEPKQVALPDETLRAIIEGWTREAGVRALDRRIEAVLRKFALRVASGESGPFEVKRDDLGALLGPRRFFREGVERVTVPGVAMGLAWTPVGGEILFVEAARVAGEGRLHLTGSLGSVMKESAEAALTWIRSHATGLGESKGYDFHIHVPAGATPKDGPSAGVAMLAALASAISGKKTRHDLAMTGEITLRGQVLPVGGIREKVLAAARAGVTQVVLPRRNEVDLDEVPQEIRKTLKFHLVDSAEQVLELALQ